MTDEEVPVIQLGEEAMAGVIILDKNVVDFPQ